MNPRAFDSRPTTPGLPYANGSVIDTLCFVKNRGPTSDVEAISLADPQITYHAAPALLGCDLAKQSSRDPPCGAHDGPLAVRPQHPDGSSACVSARRRLGPPSFEHSPLPGQGSKGADRRKRSDGEQHAALPRGALVPRLLFDHLESCPGIRDKSRREILAQQEERDAADAMEATH